MSICASHAELLRRTSQAAGGAGLAREGIRQGIPGLATSTLWAGTHQLAADAVGNATSQALSTIEVVAPGTASAGLVLVAGQIPDAGLSLRGVGISPVARQARSSHAGRTSSTGEFALFHADVAPCVKLIAGRASRTDRGRRTLRAPQFAGQTFPRTGDVEPLRAPDT